MQLLSLQGLYLAGAIVSEVIGTSALKAADGLTRPVPTLVVAVAYSVSFWLLSLCLRVFPVGVTYAVWCGVGIILVNIAAWVLYGQAPDAAALAGTALIMAGVLVINLWSASGAH
jgi:multidrug transporter EmrE-like cation transporter